MRDMSATKGAHDMTFITEVKGHKVAVDDQIEQGGIRFRVVFMEGFTNGTGEMPPAEKTTDAPLCLACRTWARADATGATEKTERE